MSANVQQVGFQLFKKTYEVSCPTAQRQSLDDAIKLLKTQTQKVHDIDPHATMDRIAVITALNLSNDYLKLVKGLPDNLHERLDALSVRIQKTLNQGKEANLS